MKLKCKLGAQCFGYVNTKTEPINIEKDKEYTLEKEYLSDDASEALEDEFIE